jgi:hypothetical protein
MQDDEIALLNACTDLVSLKKWEAFPRSLLGGKRPGEWVVAQEFCRELGVAVGGLTPDLFAAWLPDPKAHPGYVVILFYDDESKWSTAAQYNRDRLFAGESPTQALPPTGSDLPAAPRPASAGGPGA